MLRSMLRKSVSMLVCLALLGLTGCSKKSENLILTGSVEGNSVVVSAQSSGVITGIYVKEGQHVKKGDLLVKIDDRDLILKRENMELARKIAELKYQDLKRGSSKAAIGQAIANRDQFKVQLTGSDKELAYLQDQLAETQQLIQSGAEATEREKELRRAIDKEQSRHAALEQQVKSAQEALNLVMEGAVDERLQQALLEIKAKSNEILQLDLLIEKTKLVAPIDGTVQTVNFTAGESTITGQKILGIIDPSDLTLKVYINERNLSKVKLDMNVAISGEFESSEPVVGKVIHIADEAEFTPKNIESKESKQEMVFEVKIAANDKNGLIKPGMYLDADFGVDADVK